MGGCRCSYKSCRSATKTTENLHFFHYPVKHRDRCAVWIRNADKPQFASLPDYQLRNKVICGLHFENKYFANVEKKRLVHNAVPTLDAGCDSISDDLDYVDDVEILPSSNDGMTFTLNAEHLQPGPSIKKSNIIVQNGKIDTDEAEGGNSMQVYTIDPSYFNQTFFSNKEMKEVVINSYGGSNDSDYDEEHKESDNCMLIYDTHESTTNSDALSIEKQDDASQPSSSMHTTKVQNLFFDEDDDNDDIDDDGGIDEHEGIDLPDQKFVNVNDHSEHTNASSISQFSNDSNDASNHSNGSAACPSSPASVTMTRIKSTTGKNIVYHRTIKAGEIKKIEQPPTKPLCLTNKALITCLKGRVPESLLGALSLHLYKRRHVVTEEELAYAKAMHAIPTTAKLSLSKFGWYLPVKGDSVRNSRNITPLEY